MAKKSSVNRNLKRIAQSLAASVKRFSLKKIIMNSDGDEQEKAVIKLQKMKRDSSKIRIRNRCRQCGRPSGTLKKFGLCRIHLREAAMRGDVPGLKKASW